MHDGDILAIGARSWQINPAKDERMRIVLNEVDLSRKCISLFEDFAKSCNDVHNYKTANSIRFQADSRIFFGTLQRNLFMSCRLVNILFRVGTIMVNVSNSFDLLNQSQAGAAAKKLRNRQKGKNQADVAAASSPVKPSGQQQTTSEEGGEWHQQGQHAADAPLDAAAAGGVGEMEVEKEQPQGIVSANGSTETTVENGDASKESDGSGVPAIGKSEAGGRGKKKGKNKGNKAKEIGEAAATNEEGIKSQDDNLTTQQKKDATQPTIPQPEPPVQTEAERIAGIEAVAAKEAADANRRAHLWADWAAQATTAASWKEVCCYLRSGLLLVGSRG